MAGFYAWMLVLNDYGFPPTILIQNPSGEGPQRSHPLWDRGDAGYLKACTFASRNFEGRSAKPRAYDGPTFDIEDADTYTHRTAGMQQPTIESIWALNEKGYFEYTPYRGRLSAFWNDKWVSWDISRPEYRIAGNAAGGLGYDQGSKEQATFAFSIQPVGVWSACLANGGLDGKEKSH